MLNKKNKIRKKVVKNIFTVGLVLTWLLTGFPNIPYLFTPLEIKEVHAGSQTYTAGQSGTFNTPAGATNLVIELWGGGGGSAGTNNAGGNGGTPNVYSAGTGGAIRAFILQSDNTVFLEATSASNVLSAGNWYHILFTADSSSPYLRLYVNGTLVAQDTTSAGSIANGTASITIGKDGSGSTYADAQFDDVRIYNYALTPLQIREIYNSGALFFGPLQGSP